MWYVGVCVVFAAISLLAMFGDWLYVMHSLYSLCLMCLLYKWNKLYGLCVLYVLHVPYLVQFLYV